jgi:UDP-GlcNAc:undecaprenyl-phosphate/decaprenyl-phosphate GlcNAc-1-phosphate transferase
MTAQLIIAFFVSFLTVMVLTPLVIKFAHKIGATDKPNHRKVHAKIMPRLGGLAIFLGVVAGFFAAGLHHEKLTGISIGALLIIILGILDDKYELSAKVKLMGQIAAAGIVVSTGLTIDFISIPFLAKINLGIWAIPVTIFWIVAITNAINLIDGLDGLAAGISSIGIATVAFMAGVAGKSLILALALILLGSTIAFLFYNFHPAKIFMGDTGALFLGYSIGILSLLGLYKSVTLFSFIVPIIILGVPIFDTTYAIIRRVVNKKPIGAPDKSHLHHRILAIGLSHRNTVLVIYALGILFSAAAVVFETSTLWGSLLIVFGLLLLFQIIAELIGLVNERHKPLIKMYRKVTGKH